MQYAYGMRARGFSIGCQPKEGFVERIDDRSETYWDILLYSRELTQKEVEEYELEYLGKVREQFCKKSTNTQ